MIILNATDKSLEVVLGGAVATNELPIVASFVDVTTTTYVPGATDTISNGATPVTAVAAPAASTQRQVKLLTVFNEDTVDADVIVQYNNNATIRIIAQVTLAPGSTLVYTDGEGFRVIDASGQILTSGSGGGGTPGGLDTQVQFNDGGAFGGDAGLTYDKTNNRLTVGDNVTAGDDYVLSADGGLRRDTADGADDGFVSVTGGGAVNDNTRGGNITMTGNEFGGGLDGSVHISSGDVAGSAVRVFIGGISGAIVDIDDDGNVTIFDDAGNITAQFAGATRLLDLRGGQLKFPGTQIPSSNANTQDDYEEGTWQPIIGGTTSETGQSYTNQEGAYVKIGKLVIAQGFARFSAKGTITGSLVIKNLPFTIETGVLQYYEGAITWYTIVTSMVSMAIQGLQNTATAILLGSTAASNSQATDVMSTTDLDDDSGFMFTIIYRAAA